MTRATTGDRAVNLRLPLRRKTTSANPGVDMDVVAAIHGVESLQLERGARIYATDGPAATLRQVVADDLHGEIVALVVTPNGADHSVLMPLDPVNRSAGGALFLGMTRAQFARAAALARVAETSKAVLDARRKASALAAQVVALRERAAEVAGHERDGVGDVRRDRREPRCFYSRGPQRATPP